MELCGMVRSLVCGSSPRILEDAVMSRLALSVAVFAALLLAPLPAGERPIVFELWPGKPPDETIDIGPEKFVPSPKLTRKEVEVTESTRMITNVSKPTISIYRPAKEKDTGAAIIIC